MKRLEIVKQMVECGLVAVIRAESKEQGVKIIDAVIKGGIKAIEITMTVPGAVLKVLFHRVTLCQVVE